MKITHLTCENAVAPVIEQLEYGFGWHLEDAPSVQESYRLTVLHEGNIVYDSGRIKSNQSQYVCPQLQLKPCSEYSWTVSVWSGEEYAQSTPAFFRTGIDAFRGRWICYESSQDFLEGTQWIWGQHMQYVFALDQLPGFAYFNGAADGEYEVLVNGHIIAAGNKTFHRHIRHPHQMLDITDSLKLGENVLEFRSLSRPEIEGFAGKFTLDYDTRITEIFTGKDWKGARVLGKYPDKPWGRLKRHAIAPRLRKEFSAGAVRRAILYICGLGYYEAWINGMALGKPYLAPEYSQFDHRAYYQTYDVTQLVQEGSNCIGVELGNGYFSYHGDWIDYDLPDHTTVPWDNCKPQMICTLRLELTDGSVQEIVSDTSWQSAEGPLLDNSVWYGNVLDARLEQPGWTRCGFSQKWENASDQVALHMPLYPSITPRVEQIEVLEPLHVLKLGAERYVYVFSRITAGLPRLTFSARRGKRIRVVCGETLKDGRVDCSNGNGYQEFQASVYIPAGLEQECFQPKFCYMGFQYIMVEGLDVPCTVQAIVLHSNIAVIGNFRCASELLNLQYRNGVNSLRTNFHSIPTDTPVFEKRGWTGDTQLIADCSMFSLDMHNFYIKWLQDLADTQNEQGLVSITAPGPCLCEYTPAWQCAFVVIPYHLYKMYGDTITLRKYYAPMKRYGMFEYQTAMEYTPQNPRYVKALSDWLSPEGTVPPEGGALCSLAYAAFVQQMMAQIAQAVGNSPDAAQWEDQYHQIKKLINQNFSYSVNDQSFRQASALLPLAFGLAEDPKRTFSALMEDIHERGDKLDIGFSVKYLLPILTERGELETAWRIAVDTEFPSWGHIVTLGATSCWEGWAEQPRSRNHFYLACINQWFFAYLCGISPLEAGFARSLIRPYLPKNLAYAEAETVTPYGRLSCKWSKEKAKAFFSVTIPCNTSARLELPGRCSLPEAEYCDGRTVLNVSAGSYTIVTNLQE